MFTLETEEPVAIGRDIAPWPVWARDVGAPAAVVAAIGASVDVGTGTDVVTIVEGSWLAWFGGSCDFVPYSIYCKQIQMQGFDFKFHYNMRNSFTYHKGYVG